MRTIPRLPPGLAGALRPELPGLASEILDAIRQEVPEYDRPFQGEFGRGIRLGVEEALDRFLVAIEDPEDAEPPGVYRALGRGELRQGRSLDALQAAYRVGARVAWRRLSVTAEEAGFAVADQHLLAEAIFAYIDELASESVEGYAQAQAATAGERDRRREALVALLLSGEQADTPTLRRTALEAGWPLPRTLAVIVCGTTSPARVARQLDPDALHGTARDTGCVVVPNPPGGDVAIPRTLRARLGVGPAVPIEQATRSFDLARRALALPGTGNEPVVATEHLVEIVIHALPEVTEALRDELLAPLADETPASRARLLETLSAWLRHQGRRAAIAEELHVHPQTVRYRVARLRELLGDALDDADSRFALELALRAG